MRQVLGMNDAGCILREIVAQIFIERDFIGGIQLLLLVQRCLDLEIKTSLYRSIQWRFSENRRMYSCDFCNTKSVIDSFCSRIADSILAEEVNSG